MRLAYLRWAVVTVPFILLVGFTSARLLPTGRENPWYARLVLPEDMPPEWAFPAAWAAIYVFLGLALAMIINARGSTLRGPAIVVFAVLMGGNFLWPLLFFGMQQIFWSMVLIGALGALGLVTLILFGRILGAAAVLVIPYIAWLGYAGFLLYQLDRLNPNAESMVPSRSTDQLQII
ncbi:MAG: TspO/MBR family protein [Sphingomonas sp.]